MLTHNDTTKPRRGSGLARFIVGAASALSLTLCASGCIAEAGVVVEPVYGYSTAYIEAPPAAIYTYPRHYYRGHYAYLVGGRWYYDTPDGWVVFRSEPRELAERRYYILTRPHDHHPPRTRHVRPRYYDERRVPASPQEPVERGRRYYPH